MEIIQIFTIFLILTAHVSLVLSTAENPNDREPALLVRNGEPIPAESDPEIAHLVEMMNMPEPWDHL
jgi:hypothetical protein